MSFASAMGSWISSRVAITSVMPLHRVTKRSLIDISKDMDVTDKAQPGDMIYVSEKIVAISQGRAFPIDEMNPSWLAKFLVKFVYKSPHGIGISSPYTMQLALEDVGLPRILLGCAAAAVTKPFGIRGALYKVCGYRARAIDGPADGVIAPYNRYAKRLGYCSSSATK